MGEKLTSKQQMFVKEYLVDLNATQAAIRAGYSPNGAEVTGHRLLINAKIAEQVDRAKEKRADKVGISAEDVLNSIREIRDEARAAEKYSDSLKANELLGKHLKLFTDKVEQETTIKVVRKTYGD